MKLSLNKSNLKHLVENRNAFMGIAFISVIANLVLVLGIIFAFVHERVILTPPEINRPMWVGYNDTSSEYLAEMSDYLLHLRFDATPNTADYSRNKFLDYVSPSLYDDVKQQMLDEKEHMEKEHVTFMFYPVDSKIDQKNLVVDVTGDLSSVVGNVAQTPQRITYRITYDYHNGRLFVKSLDEVTKNA